MFGGRPELLLLVLPLFGLLSGSAAPCCHERTGGSGDAAARITASRLDPELVALGRLLVQVAAANEERQSSPQRETSGQILAESTAISHDGSGTAGTLGAETAEETSEAHRCLSLNVYWEARNQSLAGQIAVAQVTVNRARDPRYPDDICEVVYDHKQFSWYWDGKSDWPVETRAWETSKLVASAAMAGTGHAGLQGVTHYHAVYVQPYWRDAMTQVTVIGDHIFYLDSSRPRTVRRN